MSNTTGTRILAIVISALLFNCGNVFEYTLEDTEKDQQRDGHEDLKDAISEAVLPSLVPSATRYADGYTEEAFRSLPLGSSQNEAKSALGEPLFARQCDDDATCWYYSEASGEPENYYVRVLEFDQDGNLAEKHRSFYMD